MTYYVESPRPHGDPSIVAQVNRIVTDRWYGHVPGLSETRNARILKLTPIEIMKDNPGAYLMQRGWRQYKNMNKWISPHDKKYYSTAHAVSIQYHLEEDSTL